MHRIALLTALLLSSLSAAAGTTTYRIDEGHTNVLASWSHGGYSNPSVNFGQVTGTLVYVDEDPTKSTLTVDLPLAGLSAFTPTFNEHLRGERFFDAARYPAIKFTSTKVEVAGEGRLKVTGDLTIKATTQPVELQVTVNKAGKNRDGKPKIGFDAVATVSRTAFGMGMAAPMVSDAVQLRITSEWNAD